MSPVPPQFCRDPGHTQSDLLQQRSPTPHQRWKLLRQKETSRYSRDLIRCCLRSPASSQSLKLHYNSMEMGTGAQLYNERSRRDAADRFTGLSGGGGPNERRQQRQQAELASHSGTSVELPFEVG
ncbi:hypothetical protein EYF80_040409 [Liparis tanakae]|uniref:Uncharacterized protein n=1 Tax=Liparis tanakae TaxID=230148 RepID=A0A4Z2G763_9TELE|nr:hypothetical protein EYF80_040409 [Liparis tanakae]